MMAAFIAAADDAADAGEYIYTPLLRFSDAAIRRYAAFYFTTPDAD